VKFYLFICLYLNKNETRKSFRKSTLQQQQKDDLVTKIQKENAYILENLKIDLKLDDASTQSPSISLSLITNKIN
jgi:hypothetical protein